MNPQEDRAVRALMLSVESVMNACNMPDEMRGAFLSHYLLALIVIRLERLLDRRPA